MPALCQWRARARGSLSKFIAWAKNRARERSAEATRLLRSRGFVEGEAVLRSLEANHDLRSSGQAVTQLLQHSVSRLMRGRVIMIPDTAQVNGTVGWA